MKGRVLSPACGRRSGLASTHPAPRQEAGAMTMCPGTGLLSQKIERGRWPAHAAGASVPGALVTLPVSVCVVAVPAALLVAAVPGA